MDGVVLLTAMATLGGFLGNLFLVYKRIEAFYIWLIANSIWIIADIWMGWYSQIPVWIIYQGFAIWAIVKWGETRVKSDENTGCKTGVKHE